MIVGSLSGVHHDRDELGTDIYFDLGIEIASALSDAK